jgi:uncharacterized protein (DUF885 family)
MRASIAVVQQASMHRRDILKTFLLVTGTVAADALPRALRAADTPDHSLRVLLDTILGEELQARPQSATAWGLDSGPNAKLRGLLNDYSSTGRNDLIADHRSRLARLGHVSRHKLSASSRVDHDVVHWATQQIVDWGRRFPFGEGPWTPYAVSQLTGPYQSVPDFLATTHPVRTRDDAEAYLARLDQFATALDASSRALQEDAARGVLAPDFALDTTIAQLQKLGSPRPESHGLAVSLASRAASAALQGDWAGRATQLVGQRVYPAVERQLAAVQRLRPQARPDAGIWKIRDGEAFYAGALEYQTTTRRRPDDVHRFGLDQVASLTAQLDALLRAQGFKDGTVAARIEALSRQPDQLFPNTDTGRAELLRSLNEQAETMRARLPRAFRTLPKAPFEIVRVPPEIEDGAPNGYARGAPLDGSRPSRYYINLKDTTDWPRFSLPTLTYHEALPGHVWQGAIARESTDIPLIRRVGFGFAAYGEGWALYSERLADELGAYEHDPLGRIGFLQSLLFRAVRLVVDTGLHALRWTRGRAIDYMVDATAIARPRVQREIDRYCVWPGQACSYLIGYSEWTRLRDQAHRRAGSRFDLRAFHDVLRQGRMPLVVLERVTEA